MQKATVVISILFVFATSLCCQTLMTQGSQDKQSQFIRYFEKYWQESNVYLLKNIEDHSWLNGSLIDNELKAGKFLCLHDGLKPMEWKIDKANEKEARLNSLSTVPQKWSRNFLRAVNKNKNKRRNRLVKLGYPIFFDNDSKALNVVLWDQSTEVYFFEYENGKWQRKCYTLLSIS